MYKECFRLMDINKDGTIDKNDLRGAFDNVGVLMSEGELDELLGELFDLLVARKGRSAAWRAPLPGTPWRVAWS